MLPFVLYGNVPLKFSARVGLALLLWICVGVASPPSGITSSHSLSSQYKSLDAVCSRCHSEIVAKYAKTAMAHASGSASDGPMEGEYFHKPSKVDYRLQETGGKLWLDFNRNDGQKLEGKRELLYYIGSGQLKGRTYLFEVGGFLFESPINWYAQQRLWDMTPNY